MVFDVVRVVEKNRDLKMTSCVISTWAFGHHTDISKVS